MYKRNILLWVGVIVIASNCNVMNNATQAPSLKHKSYLLVSAVGMAKPTDSFPSKTPEITFNDSPALAGNTGCNAFFGEYTQQQSKLKMKVVGMTKMFCMGVDETGFVSALESIDSFALVQSNLNLYSKGALVMVFKENKPNKL